VEQRLLLVSFQVRPGALSNSGISLSSASGVIPPAAPFAVPIAPGLIFAAWVYKVYLTTYEHNTPSHQI
jgi:hypothetical protein